MTPRETYQRALTWAWKGAWALPGIAFQANITTEEGLTLLVALVDLLAGLRD